MTFATTTEHLFTANPCKVLTNDQLINKADHGYRLWKLCGYNQYQCDDTHGDDKSRKIQNFAALFVQLNSHYQNGGGDGAGCRFDNFREVLAVFRAKFPQYCILTDEEVMPGEAAREVEDKKEAIRACGGAVDDTGAAALEAAAKERQPGEEG